MNTTTLNMTTLDGGVIIKKSEGGGSTPPSGGSNVEYLDTSEFALEPTQRQEELFRCALYHKILFDNKEGFRVSGVNAFAWGPEFNAGAFIITAIAIDFSQEVKLGGLSGSSSSTMKEFLFSFGLTQAELDAIPRITKEEFYNLD